MKKILITGGACAGKTTVLEIIKNYLINNNYNVNIIEEVPTRLIYDGITPDKIGKMKFQELIIKTQIDNERNCNYDGVVILDQTTPNMIQRIIGIFERKPLISKEI